jgi:hypothetical protein
MKQLDVRPILVTGAHRTGTTWVGKSLAIGGQLAYVSEPLNVQHRPGVLRAKVPYWYAYICSQNDGEYLPSYLELLAYRYHAAAELASLRSGRDALRMCRDFTIFLGGRVFGKRALWKDPFAVFSLAWFANRLNCEVVVTVRHPAAFASSLKRLNWAFDFGDLLRQPLLMRDYLEPYRSLMQSGAADNVVGQAGLLWKMIYQTVHATGERVPSVHVVRHEDLSQDPAAGFRGLFGKLGLDFTRRVERKITDSSSANNPAELPAGRAHSVRLDSRANLHHWKRRLTAEEISQVRRLTEEVAALYYPESSWN